MAKIKEKKVMPWAKVPTIATVDRGMPPGNSGREFGAAIGGKIEL